MSTKMNYVFYKMYQALLPLKMRARISFESRMTGMGMLIYVSTALTVLVGCLLRWPVPLVWENPLRACTFLLGAFLLKDISTLYRVTGWESLTRLPLNYYAKSGCLILLTSLTWQSQFLQPGWGFLLLCSAGNALVHALQEWDERTEEKVVEQALRDVRACKKQIPSIQFCSICQKEGIYEVCLDCERTYRNERHRVRAQNMRAKQAGVPATLTLKEWLDILDFFQRRCAYCQTEEYAAMEHHIPIIEGGGTTADNCVPACLLCNSRKGRKHPEYLDKPQKVALEDPSQGDSEFLKDKIEALYKANPAISAGDIKNQLGCSRTTAANWLRKARLPKQENSKQTKKER